MASPSASPARVSGYDGDFTSPVVDRPLAASALQPDIPSSRLTPSARLPPSIDDPKIVRHLASSSAILKSSRVNLNRSYTALAELETMVSATRRIIHATQQRIVDSDRVIQLSRGAPPPWTRRT